MLLKEAKRHRRFARRVEESAGRVLVFKKKSPELKHHAPAPSAAKLAKLSRQLWEFGEQVRLESIKASITQENGDRRGQA
jgi:hypothetical protein